MSLEQVNLVRDCVSNLSNYIVVVNLGLLAHDHHSLAATHPSAEAFSLVPTVDRLAERYPLLPTATRVPVSLVSHAVAARWLYHDTLASLAEPLPPDAAEVPGMDSVERLLRVSVFTAGFAASKAGDVMLPPKPPGLDLGLPVVLASGGRSPEDALDHRLACQDIVARQLCSLDFAEPEATLIRGLLFDE